LLANPSPARRLADFYETLTPASIATLGDRLGPLVWQFDKGRKIEAQGELIKTIRGAGCLFAASVRRK